MKTIIVLSALATIAIAVPAHWGKDNVEHDSRLNGVLKTIKRERKSVLQESPAELSMDHESGSSHTGAAKEVQMGKTQKGFRKPIIVKKKMGYRIYRDSDEETAQAEPRENCRRQFRFKLCDESGEPAGNNMRSFNTEDIDESDVEHSLKMAKEAVEILQRDLQKIEENAKLINKNRVEEDLEGKLHKSIEQARQPSEQLNQNIAKLESLDLKTVTSKESNSDVTISKSEEARMAQWKEAIENIQKNTEIVKNIEDNFKSAEHSQLISGDDMDLSKTRTFETRDSTNIGSQMSESNVQAREIEIAGEKVIENLSENMQDKQSKDAENDMETFATENKQVNVGLHSDSLKLDAANWDITENVRHAPENDVPLKVDEVHEVQTDIVKQQEKSVQSQSSQVFDSLKMINNENSKDESKSAQNLNDLESNQMSKKTEELFNIDATKIEHEKSATLENHDENWLMKSNNLDIVEEGFNKQAVLDEALMKSAEDESIVSKTIDTAITTLGDKDLNQNQNRVEEKDAQTSESRNLINSVDMNTGKAANEESVQDGALWQKTINNEKGSIVDSNTLETQIPIMRSVEDMNISTDIASKSTKSTDANNDNLRENFAEKQELEKTTNVKKEQETNNLREVEEKYINQEINSPQKTFNEQTEELKKDLFKSTVADDTQTTIHEHDDAKLSMEKQISDENTGFQKSVDLNNGQQQSNFFNNDQNLSLQKNNDRKTLDEVKNLRFVEESGDFDHNLPQITPKNHGSGTAMGFQQRMSEMDFFNNLNSQHTAQLVQDKNLDFHTSSHINEGLSDWDRQQQQYQSMLQKPFMPWMHDRQRNNLDMQLQNNIHNEQHLANLHLDDHRQHDHHQHEHNLGNFNLDDHHHHAVPMGRFVNNIQKGMSHEMLNSPMMRDNILENSGALDLDTLMQPSMHMNMRDSLDQNGMHWNYRHNSGKSGFGSGMPLVGSGLLGTGAVGIFPNANGGCGIPLLLSCSPSVVSGSLAKQSSLGYNGHAYRSGDDMRLYSKRDAQSLNEPATKVKTFAATPA